MHENPVYPYRRSADQDAATAVHHPVLIVGAGPTGLSAAIDLALAGVTSVVLDDNNTVSVGSRGICFAKRTLEIWDRYGCAERVVDKGVGWQRGKVFFKDRQVYDFNLQPEGGHKMPAFINLQQYYAEEYLVETAMDCGSAALRWNNEVVGVQQDSERVLVDVATPDGPSRLTCDYLVVADGAGSPVRDMLGLESEGQVFNDQFLIADIVMKADFPTERWFWFDPPFHRNQSVLLHRQADDVWRVDFQLGPDADPEEAKRSENIAPRIKAMLGQDVEWELEWASVYRFRCRKMDSLVHGRVLFTGDAAHQVSPFGARGANGGVQGVDNLCWKLAAVLDGRAPQRLLDSYDDERQWGARENILNSTRATDFITPKSRLSRVFRDSVLTLSEHYPFARSLVNSGRLSVPCTYELSPLNTADEDAFSPAARPGSVCPDAPVVLDGEPGWLLSQLGGRFVLLVCGVEIPADAAGALGRLGIEVIEVGQDLLDAEGLIDARYDLAAGGAYLIRPDQHVCARWRWLDERRLRTAHQRALGFELGEG
jgi:3-(3-hydroxy-phenyl)propionate hydroxylase